MENNLNIPNFDELNSSNNSLHETTFAGLNEIEPNLAGENTSTDSQINEIEKNTSEIRSINTNEIIVEKKKPNFIEKKEYFANNNVKAEDVSYKSKFKRLDKNIISEYLGIDKFPLDKKYFSKSKNVISKEEIKLKILELEEKKKSEGEVEHINVPKENKVEKKENNYKIIPIPMVLVSVAAYGFKRIATYLNTYDGSSHIFIYDVLNNY